MKVFYCNNGAQGEIRTHTHVKVGDFEFISPIVFKRVFVEHCSFFSA